MAKKAIPAQSIFLCVAAIPGDSNRASIALDSALDDHLGYAIS
jgi:hypothetical protein